MKAIPRRTFVNPRDIRSGRGKVSDLVRQWYVIVFEWHATVNVEAGVEGGSAAGFNLTHAWTWRVVDAEVITTVT